MNRKNYFVADRNPVKRAELPEKTLQQTEKKDVIWYPESNPSSLLRRPGIL